MSTFVKYLNEVEIIEDWTGNWQTVDLKTYGVDPTAKAVTLRLTGRTGEASINIGAREISDPGTTGVVLLSQRTYCNTIVSLAGGTTVRLFAQISTPGRFFITGEVHDAVIYDEPIHQDIVELDFATWLDRQPTPQGFDTLADISAVIVRCWSFDSSIFGIRHPNSENIVDPEERFGGYQWKVIGLDANGFYSIYSTGKTGTDTEFMFFNEVGYILKTSNVVTIKDRPLPINLIHDNAFHTADISSLIPENTIVAGMRFRNSFTVNKRAFVRSIGSTDGQSGFIQTVTKTSNATPMVTPSAAREIEYKSNFLFNLLNVEWYEFTPPVLGLVKGTGEASAAVAGTSEARAAVAGTAEAHVAVAGTGEAIAAAAGTSEARAAVAGRGQVLK